MISTTKVPHSEIIFIFNAIIGISLFTECHGWLEQSIFSCVATFLPYSTFMAVELL